MCPSSVARGKKSFCTTHFTSTDDGSKKYVLSITRLQLLAS